MFPDLARDDVFHLETPRLWLRWPRAKDVTEIARLAGDVRVAGTTANIPHPYPRGAAAEFILTARKANCDGEKLVLALTPKREPNRLIGVVEFAARPDGKLDIGYWLGTEHRGQGLMSEAIATMVEFAFIWTDARAIEATVLEGNDASVACLASAGFRRISQGYAHLPARGAGLIAVERHALTRAAWRGEEPTLPAPALGASTRGECLAC